MHSSEMRTALLLTVFQHALGVGVGVRWQVSAWGGVCPIRWGVCLGVSAQGDVCLGSVWPVGVSAQGGACPLEGVSAWGRGCLAKGVSATPPVDRQTPVKT